MSGVIRNQSREANRYERAPLNCRLEAWGLVNCLGSSREQIAQRMFSGDTSFVKPNVDLVPDACVRVGRVEEHLPEIPSPLSKYDYYNNRLLLGAFLQIEDAVTRCVEEFGAHRVGVIIGSSTSGIAVNEEAVIRKECSGESKGKLSHLYQEMGASAQFLADYAALKGPAYTQSTACSSSSKVFASAKNILELGLCDAMIVGGADTLSKLTANGFYSLNLLTEEATNPLSRNRLGINIGEGAALCVMLKRHGGIQLLGVGESSDAYHFSAPDPSGRGAVKAMQIALDDASVTPDQIGYLNLHGTGTPANDKMEAQAIGGLFPELPLCSSTKPMTGHLLGASGATELAFCALALENNKESFLPPHCWDEERDPDLPVIEVVKANKRYELGRRTLCMSNSFAFGGSNVSLVIGRCDE